MRRLLIFMVFFSLGPIQYAQPQGFQYYDSLTYQSYLNRSWSGLTTIGKQALKADIDYYYLRVRMGIACYERKNYIAAERHFRKALSFNSQDQFVIFRLYTIYSLLNRDLERERLVRKSNEIFRSGGVDFRKAGFFDYFIVEAGFRKPENGLIVRNAGFFQAGLSNQVGGRLQVYHSYQRFRQGYEEIVESGLRRFRYNYGLYQDQYYLGIRFLMLRDWYLKSGFHLQHVGGAGLNLKNQMYYFGLSKNLSRFQLRGNFYLASINNENFQQWTGAVTWYPGGNLNFYLGTEISGFSNRQGLISNYFAGFKLLKPLWLSGFYTDGIISNYLENDGLSFFNNQDDFRQRYGVTASIHFSGGNSIWVTGFNYTTSNNYISASPFQQIGMQVGTKINF